MTPAHLIALFGFGCAAHSLLAWLSAAHPALYSVGVSVYIIGFLLWAIAFFMDDLFSPFLGLDTRTYHAVMIAFAASAVLGVSLVCLAPGMQ